MDTHSSLNVLRKQATLLENEIDKKLTLLCKTCTGKADGQRGDSCTAEDRLTYVSSVAAEIEVLLQKLTFLNEQMSDIKVKVNDTLFTQRTLLRHREILADYTSEFNKTLENYKVQQSKEELMRSVRSTKAVTSSGLNRRTDVSLKENEHIRSCSRLVDDQILIAIETREELMSQRFSMKKLQSRLNDVSNRLPSVNNLIYRITVRRRRDYFILGLIAFLCILFIFSTILH